MSYFSPCSIQKQYASKVECVRTRPFRVDGKGNNISAVSCEYI